MTNSDAIRAIINAYIKTNRKQEITGKILNSVLNQMVTDKDAGISEESELRAAEDERIEGLINKEIGDRESADAAISEALFEEVTARKNADTNINDALSAETSARQDEDAAIRNALSEEMTARQDADTNISNALSEEATTRENADTVINNTITNISNALSEEKTAREEGDTSLLNAIRDAFSKGYLFAGVATTDTNPGSPEGKVFYIANGKGIYTNFGGLEVTDDDDFAIFTYDDAWAKSNVTLSSGGGIAQTMTETTYAELKNMRDNGTLTPGMWYRITDYECTTTQSNTISAGNKFDVIVLATSTNTLSEQAKAINHTPQEGETDYFANSNLSAWQIWYCLNNDTNRFAWADTTNGKGVIYRMIDEWNNDVPYDFKNIKFKHPLDKNTYPYYYYTFASENVEDNTDNSLDIINFCCFNTIKLAFEEIQFINCNLFIGISNFGNFLDFNCIDNFFETGGIITLGKQCSNNIFRPGCSSIILGVQCNGNKLGKSCKGITFGRSCNNNNLGEQCQSFLFGDGCSSNKFGNRDRNIILDTGCSALSNEEDDVANKHFLIGTSSNSFSFITNKTTFQFVGLDSSNILKFWNPADLVQ